MTATPSLTVLVVGATGSIGRLVVEEALDQGHTVRALVRDQRRASSLPAGAEIVVGDLTRAGGLGEAVDGVDAVVFTHGSRGGGPAEMEKVDYGAVRHVLAALGDRPARIALMTLIGVTNRSRAYAATGGPDWKRRSERLVRASGRPYTVVRPGWFDYNSDDELDLRFLQGDRRHAGGPEDGVISRRQIAQVLVTSLTSPAAERTSLELVAEKGPAPVDLEPLFAALDRDEPGALDAVHDLANLPLDDEPERVREDLAAVAPH